MGASFVQEVAEIEQGVPRCQELQKSLQERTDTQGLVYFSRHKRQIWNETHLALKEGEEEA